MRYCTQCLMPDTKPYLTFDGEGVCNGCLQAAGRRSGEAMIDWAARARAFDALVEAAKGAGAPLFDAMVPVSGGKDSITQVSRLLGRGLRILAINIDYGLKTEIGERNLALIPAMGAHLMVFTPEQDLHRQLVRIGFEDYGDPDLMSHCLLHAMPLRIAIAMKIPFVLMGENAAAQYGGDEAVAAAETVDRRWYLKYVANSGHDPASIAKRYGIAPERLLPYDFPDDLAGSGVRAVFMNSYFPWDSQTHFEIAQRYGFQALLQPAEGTYRNFVGIDEKLHRLHQYLKVLKFGYGRATDHACEDIREGHLTRDEAKALVREHDLKDLSEENVNTYREYFGMTRERFLEVLETYRDTAIWQKGNDGRWLIPGHLQDEA
jgi:N-acetyl sugar amidotransferase